MFHRAVDLEFKEGTIICVTFQGGEIMQYDVSGLFEKYPQLEALKDRSLFCSGRLQGAYGIVWTDELDLEAETVYEDGTPAGMVEMPLAMRIGDAVSQARSIRGMTQKDLAEKCGITQSDISKVERGAANPSALTLQRIAEALGCRVNITFE